MLEGPYHFLRFVSSTVFPACIVHKPGGYGCTEVFNGLILVDYWHGAKAMVLLRLLLHCHLLITCTWIYFLIVWVISFITIHPQPPPLAGNEMKDKTYKKKGWRCTACPTFSHPCSV